MKRLLLQNRWEVLKKLDGDDDDEEEEEAKQNKEEEEVEVVKTVGNWVYLRRKRKDLFNQMLPDDIKCLIFSKVGAIDILMRVQYVCCSWWKLSKDPRLYRVIDARYLRRRFFPFSPDRWINARDLGHCSCKYYECQCRYDYTLYTRWKHHMIRRAVDRSCGQLVSFAMGRPVTDDLLHYVFDNSKSLKCLLLPSCSKITDDRMIQAFRKVPLLEEIELFDSYFQKEEIEEIGRSCLNLQQFALHGGYDEEAFAIAENMPKLRELRLTYTLFTNEGLQAILGGCPCLEYLDIRGCDYLNLTGNLLEQCEQRLVHITCYPSDDYGYGYDYDYDYDDDDDYDYEYYKEQSEWSYYNSKYLPPKAMSFYI